MSFNLPHITFPIKLNYFFQFLTSVLSSAWPSGPNTIAISQTVFAYTDAHPSPVQCYAII